MYDDVTTPIRYCLNRDDYVNFQLYCTKQSPTKQRSIRLNIYLYAASAGVLFFTLVYLVEALLTPGPPICIALGFIAVFGGFIISILTAVILHRNYPKIYSKRLNKHLDTHRIKTKFDEEELLWLNNKGIVYRTENGSEGLASWASFRAVETTENYAYIFCDATRAWIVPTRAFADNSKFDEFVRIVRENIQSNSLPTEKPLQSFDS